MSVCLSSPFCKTSQKHIHFPQFTLPSISLADAEAAVWRDLTSNAAVHGRAGAKASAAAAAAEVPEYSAPDGASGNVGTGNAAQRAWSAALDQMRAARQAGVALSPTAVQLLATPSLEDPAAQDILRAISGGKPLQKYSVVTCMGTLYASRVGPYETSHLLVGTEASQVLFLGIEGNSLIGTVALPAVPSHVSCQGTFEVDSRVAVAARDGNVYMIKNKKLTASVCELGTQITSLALLSSHVFVATIDRVLHCFDYRGTQMWRQVLESPISCLTQMQVGTGNTISAVAVATDDGTIAVYSPEKELLMTTADEGGSPKPGTGGGTARARPHAPAMSGLKGAPQTISAATLPGTQYKPTEHSGSLDSQPPGGGAGPVNPFDGAAGEISPDHHTPSPELHRLIPHEVTIADPVTAMRFGRYGREDNTLVTIHASGALTVRVLPRRTSLGGTKSAGPPAEQSLPLAVPKKSRLYLTYAEREKASASRIHDVFQRDLMKLRLTAAKAYVRLVTHGRGPSTTVGGATVTLSCRVDGVGPLFRLVVKLSNTGSTALLGAVLVAVELPNDADESGTSGNGATMPNSTDRSIYRLNTPLTPFDALLPQVSREHAIGVSCNSQVAVAAGGRIAVFLVKGDDFTPLVSARVDMPPSQPF